MSEGPVYTIADLLVIRDSSLCVKPSSLPALEEWMGSPPPPRPTPARATRTSEDLTQDDTRGTTPKRPLYGHLSRTSTTEDIVLGPPKMAFASASAQSRKLQQEIEASDKAITNSTTNDDERGESPRFERFGGLGRFSMQNKDREKDRDRPERDSRAPRGQNMRGGPRDEGDGWTSVTRQPRKSFGIDEGERFKRDKEGVKEPYKDYKERAPKYEAYNRGDRDGPRRRDGGRRDESSWFLTDEVRAARNAEKEREFREQREQRGEREFRNGRDSKAFGGEREGERDGYQRDHHRSGNTEKDPEWLDAAPDEGNEQKAHSMEEFQRWKARMKAGNAAEEPEPSPQVEREQLDDEVVFKSRKEMEKPVEKEPSFTKAKEPQQSSYEEALPTPSADNDVDRFFSVWNSTNNAQKPPQSAFFDAPAMQSSQEKVTAASAAATRASKFKNFFNAPEPSQEPVLLSPMDEPRQNQGGLTPSNEDQAGFQRILGMFERAKISSPSNSNDPPSASSQNPLLSLLGSGPAQNSSSSQLSNQLPPNPSPFSASSNHTGRSSVPQSLPLSKHHQQSSDQTSVPGPRDANSEFLLKLMRQTDHPTPQGPPPPTFLQGMSQMSPPPNLSNDAQRFHRNHTSISSNSPYPEDPAIRGYGRPEQRGSAGLDHQRGPSVDQRGQMDMRPPPGMEQRGMSIEQRLMMEQQQRNGSSDRLPMDHRGLPMDLRNLLPLEGRGLPPMDQQRGLSMDLRGPPMDPRGMPLGLQLDSQSHLPPPGWPQSQQQQGQQNSQQQQQQQNSAGQRPPPGFYGRPTGPSNSSNGPNLNGMNGPGPGQLPPLAFFGPGNLPPPFGQPGMPPPPNLQNLPPNFPPFGLGGPPPPQGYPPFAIAHEAMMPGLQYSMRPDGLRSPPHQQQPGAPPPGMFSR